jgi:hypothetical protein
MGKGDERGRCGRKMGEGDVGGNWKRKIREVWKRGAGRMR